MAGGAGGGWQLVAGDQLGRIFGQGLSQMGFTLGFINEWGILGTNKWSKLMGVTLGLAVYPTSENLGIILTSWV